MAFYENTLVAKQDLAEKEIKTIKDKYNDIIKGASGKVIKKQRNLYYFQSDKLSDQDNSWTDWKIYMISNIEI